VWAFLASTGSVAFSYIDKRYSGREVSDLPDGVIVHDSAHHKQIVSVRGRIKTALRSLERQWLRSGRSRAMKHQLQAGANKVHLG